MTDFRQIFDNRTNGGEWSIWSNMVSQMEIRIMTKISNSSPLSIKIYRTENQACYFQKIYWRMCLAGFQAISLMAYRPISDWDRDVNRSTDSDRPRLTEPCTSNEWSLIWRPGKFRMLIKIVIFFNFKLWLPQLGWFSSNKIYIFEFSKIRAVEWGLERS